MFDPKIPFNDLPPITSLNFGVSLDILKLAEDTRVAIEVLNYAVKTLPSPNILLDTLAFQEAKASSDIENIFTTNDELYHGVLFNEYTAGAKEVANYKEALFIGFNSLREKGLISLGDIERINEPVNFKIDGIRTNLPNFDDLTRIANVKTSGDVEIIYTPPHGKELIQSLLIDMLDYLYDDDTYAVHPLIKIALAHYQFESIHPFRDGNGRTGRILNILFLCQKGYLSYPILYASSYIIKNKAEYYDILKRVRAEGDYSDMIRYMLTSFKSTAEKTLRIVEEIKKLVADYTSDDFISKIKGQKEPLLDTIEMVFQKVYIRIRDLVDKGIHRQTAAVYLDQFVEEGLLSKEKVGKDNIYKNVKLLALFENKDEEQK